MNAPGGDRPGLLEVIAAFFDAEREAGPGQVWIGPCDRIEPELEAELVTTPDPQADRYVPAAEIDNEPAAAAAEWLASGPEDRHPYGFEPRGPGTDPEAGLGHDYDGPELRSGTPEYEALYAEYQAWAAQPDPEPEAGPVPYALTPRAEAALASWDRFHALERAERLALGEAEPEPEAEP